MLSVERDTIMQMGSIQQLRMESQVRKSLIQSAMIPYENLEASSNDRTTDAGRRMTTVDAVKSKRNALKGIHELVILLDRHCDPEQVEIALAKFRKDSLSSIQTGGACPSIKKYVDVDAGAYEPGELVCGHVSLTLTHSVVLTSLPVKLKGVYIVAYEQRLEGKGMSHTEQLIFLDTETALNLEKPGTKSSDGTELEPGTHKFKFSFQLPLNIPSTILFENFRTIYEGASVIYSIEASVNSERSGSAVAKEIFSVIRRMGDRLEKAYNMPYHIEKVSSLTCCCRSLGKLTVAASLPQLIFLQGDTVTVNVKLLNDSSLNTKSIQLALVQHSTFKNRKQSKVVLRARTTLLAHTVTLENCDEVIQQLALRLPKDMLPSTLGNISPPTSSVNVFIPPSLSIKKTRSEPQVKTQKSEDAVSATNTEKLKAQTVKSYPLLNTDYQTLYDIAYYLQIKVNTTVEWFNMKGPEIHFPVMMDSYEREPETRKASDLLEEEEESENGSKGEKAEEEKESPVDVEENKISLKVEENQSPMNVEGNKTSLDVEDDNNLVAAVETTSPVAVEDIEHNLL